MIGAHDEVILPPSQIAWLSRQQDSVASPQAAQNDAMQLEYSLGHRLAWDAWGAQLLKTDLSSSLEALGSVMHDEIAPAVDTAPLLHTRRLRISWPIVNGPRQAMDRGSAPPTWAGELHVSPVLYRGRSASTR